MKKILFVLIMTCLLTTGCWGVGSTTPFIFEETNTKMQEDMTEFEDHVEDLLNELDIPDKVVSTYESDYLSITMAQLSETIYYSIITLYNANLLGASNSFGLEGLSVKKVDDTYTLTFSEEEESTEVVIKANETSTSVVTKVDGDFSYRIEKVQLSDGEYAIQTVMADKEQYTISEFYLKGEIGRLMVDEEVTSLPTSIYNEPTAITTTFATGGDRSYGVQANEFTYSPSEDFELNVTFEENGGTVVSDYTGILITVQPITNKTGYAFIGWYSNSDLTGNPIVFPYVMTSDITLYAKWQSTDPTKAIINTVETISVVS